MLSSLTFDRRLLKSFLAKYAKDVRLKNKRLSVAEQTLPGTPEPTADLEVKKSLPDGVIFENDIAPKDGNKKHALIIESKITARLTNDQLQRHANGVRSRGFVVGGLVITADSQKTQLPDGWTQETWSGIYAWLVKQPRSTWSTELIHFFEVLETQMVNDKSIGDRALTRFDGIPFDDGHPYSYSEAKRLIRLLGSKISNDKRLCRTLDIVHGAEGRAAITDGPAVWDYFSLRKHPKGKTFTFYPHMTFSISQKSAAAMITVPNAVKRDILTALREASDEQIQAAVRVFLSRLDLNRKAMRGVRPAMILVQRRYKTQRSIAQHDAALNFDLRTSLGTKTKSREQPKYQPQWLQMAQEVIRGKHSNLQFQIGCEFAYDKCPAIHDSDAELLFVTTWLAAKAFFKSIHVTL